jgi:hypothetical protein
MILNLLRYRILTEFLGNAPDLPGYLSDSTPFIGISVNLTRAGFSAFGKRSIAKSVFGQPDESLEIDCAADFLTHFLFREFLLAIRFCYSEAGVNLRQWAGLPLDSIPPDFVASLRDWGRWAGFYSRCSTLDELLRRCESRLDAWRSFLAGGRGGFSREIVDSLTPMEDALHMMGDTLRTLDANRRISLYVTLDQYEELIGLNIQHGTELQRIVNSLLRARDPVVFYKMGVRTSDWGRETRVSGSSLKLERQRDYVQIDLDQVLLRTESAGPFNRRRAERKWLFAQLAEDVALRRIQLEARRPVSVKDIREMFGDLEPHKEAAAYLKSAKFPEHIDRSRLPEELRAELKKQSASGDLDALDLHLAIAWSWQCVKRRRPTNEIIDAYKTRPWQHKWWRKERIEFALVQLASACSQRRRFFGWDTIVFLAGGNISAFLFEFSLLWDYLQKQHVDPHSLPSVPARIQSDAILAASKAWADRDQSDYTGGEYRRIAIGRLGNAIRRSVLDDRAMSNPGHSGFSLRDQDLSAQEWREISEFLWNGLKWGVFEVRPHRSKQKGDGPRHKWYLHPLLSPILEIPFKRVKEPLYINDLAIVKGWFFENGPVKFAASPPTRPPSLPFP